MAETKETKTESRRAAGHEGVAKGPGAIERTNGSAPSRVTVNKAYKMFVGGAFIRGESGRYFQVHDDKGVGADPEVVNIPRGSRKDIRDAVLVAKNAFDSWAGRTPYNRGQIVYRLAEVIESRRSELTQSLVRGGASEVDAAREVDMTIDRSVYYAGFCDKVSSLVASHNPVAGPHFGFSIPEPMGVIGIVAPERPVLLGLVSTALPVIAGGNTAVVIVSEKDPRTAIVFAECLATSDLPGGVVNLLTGQAVEMAPHLAKHREVNGIDAWSDDKELLGVLEREGAGSVKRVKTHSLAMVDRFATDDGQGLGWIERYLETKTVWHPVGV